MHRVRLYVNIDHIATVRQARRTDEPDPVEAAVLAEAAGADGITAHLREDRRHIQDDDIERLARAVRTVLNLELALSQDILELACRLRPFQATLVPERREEVTTEGGLDLGRDPARLRTAIRRLTEAGIRVSLFIDPTAERVRQAVDLDVPAVEFHTGRYAHAWPEASGPLAELQAAARQAQQAGLAVHVGHGLTLRNVAPVAMVPEVEELNIGHSIVSRATMIGMEHAVGEMRQLVDATRRKI